MTFSAAKIGGKWMSFTVKIPANNHSVVKKGQKKNSLDTGSNADPGISPAHNARSVPPQSSSGAKILQASPDVNTAFLFDSCGYGFCTCESTLLDLWCVIF